VSGKVILSTSNVVKPLGGRDCAPDPAGEVTMLSKPPSWWGEAGWPLPKNSTSALGSPGLEACGLRPIVPP